METLIYSYKDMVLKLELNYGYNIFNYTLNTFLGFIIPRLVLTYASDSLYASLQKVKHKKTQRILNWFFACRALYLFLS